MDFEPAQKRTRTSAELGDVARSENLWFSDGSVVLRTEMTLFRVHKSMLSLHSSVFRDMFAMPQPTEQQDAVEGCPIVPLIDHAGDWEEFLSLLYNLRDMRNEDCQIPCDLMIAMLRLGHKYDFQRFRDEALEQLKFVLPDTLDDWDIVQFGNMYKGGTFHRFAVGEEFKILSVALELSLETVLPMAFFVCLQNRTTPNIIQSSYSAGGNRKAELSRDAQDTLLVGKEEIIKDCWRYVYSWWKQGTPSTRCTNVTTCMQAIHTHNARRLGVCDVMDALAPESDSTDRATLCGTCRLDLTKFHFLGREMVFAKMPSYFGLPPWHELKDFV